MNTKIVSDALRYYDENMEKYKYIINKIYTTSTQNNITDFIDKKQNILFSSKTQIIGVYNITKNIWIWGWSMSNKPNSDIYLSRKLLLYGIEIEHTNYDMLPLKYNLIQSHITINSNIQIELFCAITLYLTKKTCIYISNEKLLNDEIKIMYIITDPPKI